MAVEVPWRLRAGLGPCEVDGLLEKRGVGEVSATCAFGVGAGHKPCLALAPSSPCALEDHWWHKGPAQVWVWQ